MDLGLLYKGQNCGSLTLYADMEKIVLQSPFLGPKPFFFMWEDSPALTSQYLDGIQVSIADYLPLLFDKDRSTFKQLEEAVYPAYSDFLAGKVTKNPKKTPVTLTEKKGQTTYSCKEYIMALKNDEKLQEDYIKFYTAILENKTIRNLLKEKVAAFVDIAENNGIYGGRGLKRKSGSLPRISIPIWIGWWNSLPANMHRWRHPPREVKR